MYCILYLLYIQSIVHGQGAKISKKHTLIIESTQRSQYKTALRFINEYELALCRTCYVCTCTVHSGAI